ncbi:hypothetical protein BOTBODRAFT_30288 [Botryobasidium botryosum FD-172 SS1]|uniref:Complex 1 LYR protein domain-containing protein n=1 Tax=Botryobasidium botryosum (strain FD-172 SS1) TaxID=930990 RepID=A0A067MN06_BOTB1|nr:hypothetical protein BOTBODRAFT_30288 [Botryobasidium botryosum FD-172 SS1]
MTTIPSRLAQSSRSSSSFLQARKRSIQLYREWYRSAPEIVSLYGLNVSPVIIRARIREQFEKNRYVEDLSVIDLLLHKGRQDYQEIMNCWQQEPHILGILLKEPVKRPQTFLQKFYEGRDELAVLPASP